EQLGAFEPVGGAEGLLAEVTPTVTALEALDPVGGGATGEEAGADPVPGRGWGAMAWAVGVGAERGHEGGAGAGHASLSLQSPRRLHSAEHHRSLACGRGDDSARLRLGFALRLRLDQDDRTEDQPGAEPPAPGEALAAEREREQEREHRLEGKQETHAA